MKYATRWKNGEHRRVLSLLTAFAISVLAGSSPAKGAAGRGCEGGEFIDLLDAKVTVLDGPGDVVDEQSRWTFMTSLDRSHLHGPSSISIGGTHLDLERIP